MRNVGAVEGERVNPIKGRFQSTTAHVSGLALLFISAGMLLSAVVEYLDGTAGNALLLATLATAVGGIALWWTTRPGALDHASIFTAVGGTWVAASVVGALPYLLAGTFAVAGRPWTVVAADALFESISGYTATGSTVFGGHNRIVDQGSGILLYRQLTQWAGGMGIVVLVVTVLPSLRASGLGLIDAEAPGMGVDRLAPRVRTQQFASGVFIWGSPCSSPSASWWLAWARSMRWPTPSPPPRLGAFRPRTYRLDTGTAWPWSLS